MKTNDVAQIKACEGIYRASDVSRHFGCHRSTVLRIWDDELHCDVSPARDFPDIKPRNRATDYAEDLNILVSRGMTVKEAAAVLNIKLKTAYWMRGVFVA